MESLPRELVGVTKNSGECTEMTCTLTPGTDSGSGLFWFQQEQMNWSRLIIPTAQCLLKGIFSASEITNSVTTEEFELTTLQGMISPNCWQLRWSYSSLHEVFGS